MSTFQFDSFLKKREEFINSCRERGLLRKEMLKNFSIIFNKYRIKEAYVFGSTQKMSCFPDSDIDLYVEDLERDKYWELWHELEELADNPVDLYCQFDDPVFVEKIKKRGELIYESRS